MAVARCCCPRPAPGEQEIVTTTGTYGNFEVAGATFGYGVGGAITPSDVPVGFGRWALSSSSTTVDRVSGFLRFTGITIPQGANVTLATIEVDEIAHHNYGQEDAMAAGLGTTAGGGSARCDIHCEDNDNATVLTDAATANGLPRTLASVVGYDHSYSEYNAGATVTVTGLEPIVQEVIDRPGWAGDAIQFLFDEDGTSSFNDTGGGNSYGIFATVNDSIPGPPSSRYFSPRLTIRYT